MIQLDELVLGEGAALVFADRESIWDGRVFVDLDADVLGRFLSGPANSGSLEHTSLPR